MESLARTFPEQMDLIEALRLCEEGIAAVESHASKEYRCKLIGAIEVLIERGGEFTADDVRQIAGDPPATTHPNIAGAIVNRAARDGIIRMVGYGISSRPQGHGNLVRRWIGLKP